MCKKNGKKKGLQKKRNNFLNLFRFLNFKRFGIYKIPAKLFFKESVFIIIGIVFVFIGIVIINKESVFIFKEIVIIYKEIVVIFKESVFIIIGIGFIIIGIVFVFIFKKSVFFFKGIAAIANIINVTSLATFILLVLLFKGGDVFKVIVSEETKITSFLGIAFAKKANMDAEIETIRLIDNDKTSLNPDSLGLDLEEFFPRTGDLSISIPFSGLVLEKIFPRTGDSSISTPFSGLNIEELTIKKEIEGFDTNEN